MNKNRFEPEAEQDKKLYQIALLVSLACILQIAESMIPHPIPGLRLGLANMLTLTAMVVLGFRYALEIAIMRTLLGSLMIGTFMSPTFILSFTSAIASTLTMGFFYHVSGFHKNFRFSLIGISIVGAFTHNMVQLCLAYLLLVKHPGVFVLLPWLSLGAIGTGWVVGIVTRMVCRGIEEFSGNQAGSQAPSALTRDRQSRIYVSENSPVHRFSPEIKIWVILVMAIVVLVYDNPWLYLNLFVFLAVVAVMSRTPLLFLAARVRKFGFLIGLTFLLPLLFNSGTSVVYEFSFFRITLEGIQAGVVYSLRIILLIAASVLLMRTTSPEDMTEGLSRVLRPLRVIGVCEKRAARVLSLSWSAFPHLWDSTRSTIRNGDFHKVKNLRNLLPLLSEFIADLYLNTEPKSAIWETSRIVDSESSPNRDRSNCLSKVNK